MPSPGWPSVLKLTRILGIDFSGASDAGKKIWIVAGEGQGPLSKSRELHASQALPAAKDQPRPRSLLRRAIITDPGPSPAAIFFALPRPLHMPGKDWATFLRTFPEHMRIPPQILRISAIARRTASRSSARPT